MHTKNKPSKDFFTQEFMDFITAMIALDPSDRPTMKQIMAHPWMQGPIPDKDGVAREFAKR